MVPASHLSQEDIHHQALTDKRPWIALNMARLTWPTLQTQCAHHLTSAEALHHLCQHGISALESALPGLTEKVAAVLKSQAFAQEFERLQTAQLTVLTIVDPLYPPSLRWISDPPFVLYMRGTLQQEDSMAVAVVGSRKPSNYGTMLAQRLSTELAQHGLTVVSGLARGIDSVAHQGALQAGGRTLAVLGSGLNVIYPPENRRLYNAIGERGAVLSEFPLDTKPDRWNFPRRNRIISGLALGTLVVEAAASSGALHTARHALDQGREVFAVPGRIDAPNSRGTNGLIKNGAKLVEGVEDILAEFPEAIRVSAIQHRTLSENPSTTPQPDLTTEEAQIFALVQAEETHIDTLTHASQLPAHMVASILMTLELRGVVRQFPGKFFTRI